MKVKGFKITTRKEQLARENEAFKKGEKSSINRIKNLEKENKKLAEQIEDLKDKADTDVKRYERSIEKLGFEIEALEEDRDGVKEAVKLRLEAEDLKATQDARKSAMDSREASLKDRESKLESKEEGRYKAGYADGVADGVRKINEITAKDRENAMKVAMVAAASHTSPEIVKELNSNVKSLASGTEDTEGK